MAILAHLDDPPRPRTRGLLIAALVAAPIAGLFLFWLIPTMVAAILGGARDLDSRLRAEDGYMQALCGSEAMNLSRDESLCACVLGTEYPSLDCQAPFRHWTLARQGEACSDPDVHKQSLSFCSCVEAVATKVDAAKPEARDTEVAAYENCMVLSDAIYLPTIDALASGG
ncbi:MAG TPA: hypothetical protein VG755_30045 [Nannocystaceae bacterium]|nr:hypothetical protein [Nannocystaceae bacterium]